MAVEKAWIRGASTQTDRGEQIDLSYYLLTQPGEWLDHYGVEVVLRSEGREESALVEKLTPIGGEILRLIQCLADGSVTPTGLLDVVQDFLT